MQCLKYSGKCETCKIIWFVFWLEYSQTGLKIIWKKYYLKALCKDAL